MTAPPGLAPTTAAVSASVSERHEGIPTLTTHKARLNFMVDTCGLTYPEAHKVIRAFEKDCADARRIGNDTARSDDDFIGWLMSQGPGPRAGVPNWAKKIRSPRGQEAR